MKRLAAILGVLWFGAGSAAADTDWTSWQATNSPLIQWRFHIETYGKLISPDCIFQFQRTDDNDATFNYLVSYESSAGSTGQRKGQAYGITRSEHGEYVVNACRRITQIAVSAVKTKATGSANNSRYNQSVIEFPGKKGSALADLTGEWRREDGELVSITRNGNVVVATKITGNRAVPAGEISWEGEYTSRSFTGRGQRGLNRGGQTWWVPVTIIVEDANTIRVSGFNPDQIFTRRSPQ